VAPAGRSRHSKAVADNAWNLVVLTVR
jgi:hypothetical protein